MINWIGVCEFMPPIETDILMYIELEYYTISYTLKFAAIGHVVPSAEYIIANGTEYPFSCLVCWAYINLPGENNND